MQRKNLRHITVITVLLLVITLAAPITYAQILGEILGNIRKNYNKEPDRNEMQEPVNGKFKANPTFFAANSKNERCNAIDLWISSIRYEAMNSELYSNRRRNINFDMSMVSPRDIQKFAVSSFEDIFGVALARLSDRDVGEVANNLKNCSYQRWVEYNLENVFRNPHMIARWKSDFYRIEKERIEEKRQRAFRRAEYELGYPIDELLLETRNFDVYTTIPNERYGEWCSSETGKALISLLFKARETDEIIIDDYYWNQFEQEILPVVKSRCSSVDIIYANHYVKGFYLYNDKILYNIARPSLGQEISQTVYKLYAPDNDRRHWMYGNDYLNSIELPEDSSITSIAGIRKALTARQEILEREALDRRRAEINNSRVETDRRRTEIKEPVNTTKKNTAKKNTTRSSVAGTWNTTANAQGMSFPVTLELEQNGAAVNGTFSSSFGSGTISNIKVSGNKLSGIAKVRFGARIVDLRINGTIDGNRMSGTMSGAGLPPISFRGSKVN